jgi:hypothetical protein
VFPLFSSVLFSTPAPSIYFLFHTLCFILFTWFFIIIWVFLRNFLFYNFLRFFSNLPLAFISYCFHNLLIDIFLSCALLHSVLFTYAISCNFRLLSLFFFYNNFYLKSKKQFDETLKSNITKPWIMYKSCVESDTATLKYFSSRKITETCFRFHWQVIKLFHPSISPWM